MIALFDGWTFAEPLGLLALLALGVVVTVHVRRAPPALRFAPTRFVGTATPERGAWPRSWRVRLRWLPGFVSAAGLACAALALARPVERVQLPRTTLGIDILLCLDVSSSMTANDLDPQRSRLAVALDAARQFVDRRADDRVGLVTFARYPDLRCPPTLDHDALGRLLAGVVPVASDGPEDATGIGAALGRAAQVLARGAAKSRVVVLLTDGEENVATADKPDEIAPLHAGQLCEQLRVRVYTIAAGIGRQEADGRFVELDTAPVQKVAERTGGAFFRVRDAAALDAVYADIDRLERVEFEEPRFRFEDRFVPFLLAAFVLLLAGRVLGVGALEVGP